MQVPTLADGMAQPRSCKTNWGLMLAVTAATALLTFRRTRRRVSLAESRAEVRAKEERRLRELAHLAHTRADVIQKLQRSAPIRELLQDIAGLLVERFDAALVRVWTLAEGGQMLELQASAGLYTHINGAHGRIPVGCLKIGRIALERKLHTTNQVLGDPAIPDQAWARREGLVAFAGYPMLLEDRLLGVLGVFARHPLSPAEVEALEVIAGGLALALGRSQALLALQESEARFRQLAEAMPQMVWTAQPDGVIDYANSKGLLVVPSSARGNLGENWLLAVHPEDRQSCREAWQEAVRTGQSFETEYRVGEGTEARWYLARALPVRDTQGHIARWYGTCTDIHDLKMAHQALEAERSFSASAINSLPGIFYVVDEENRLRRWNTNLETVSGYSSKEIAQMGALDFFVPQSRPQVARAIAAGLTQGEVTVELDFQTKSGQAIPYFFSAKRFQFDGQTRLIGVGFDHTEAKRSEETLRRASA
ncbi:MAG TPA: PAS domain S-box protein, partial [Clostridia bacterium]|nr:PAS domain S-box protein [Clostridia bacterium]